jgi:hypothetical protein
LFEGIGEKILGRLVVGLGLDQFVENLGGMLVLPSLNNACAFRMIFFPPPIIST